MREQSANEKEEQKQILEESLNEIYMFDSETLKFTYVNKGALSNIGYTMKEMAEMTPLDIKPKFDIRSFGEMIEPLKNKTKQKVVFETVHKRADGSLYDVEVHLQLVQETSRSVFMAIILDITERKKAEEDKEYLTHVLEESLNEIYMFDFETLRFTYVNKGALLNIGYTMEEMAEMTPLDIKPAFDIQSFNEMIEPLRKKEKAKIEFKTVHKRADGSFYDVEVHLQLVQEAFRSVFMAIILDITERKKAEEDREHFMHVLDVSLNEIYMFDSKTLRFTYVNKGALLNIGYSIDEMAEMTPLDIKPEFDIQSFNEMIEPLRKKEKEKIEFETVHKRADGSLYDVEVHLQLVQEISRPVFMAIILDITNRRTAENEILKLNESLEMKVEERTASLLSYQNQLRSLAFQLSKAKEHERKRLAAFLHDNLGQVLAIGKMELDAIKKRNIPDEVAESFERLDMSVNDSIRYTRDFMADLKPAPSADNEGLLSNINWVADKMSKYGLEVSIRDDGKPKPITEEIENLITQSVRELLYNVVKHAEADKADVKISRYNNHVQVIVKDVGKGFNADKKPAPTKMAGFGLFNLQEQMEWLESSMEIDSSPGEGTQVKLLFPVMDKELEGTKAKVEKREDLKAMANQDQPEPDAKIKVLIADDHQLMREGLRKMIEEQEDLTVIAEASTGKEAVDLTRTYSPDIILMDIDMPGMDGIEATRQIKMNKLPVRIIGLSFHKDENVARAIIDAGASIYLSKSEVFETLCATVRSESMVLKRAAG